MGTRSVVQCQSGRASPMTAVPRTGATQARTNRNAKLPLRCNQRKHAWPHPLTALAAKLHSKLRRSLQAERSHSGTEVTEQYKTSPAVIQCSTARINEQLRHYVEGRQAVSRQRRAVASASRAWRGACLGLSDAARVHEPRPVSSFTLSRCLRNRLLPNPRRRMAR